jgi:hypothetical protein
MTHDDSLVTFNVSGTVTAADVGKAVTLDTATNTTVKLTTANSVVIGRLETLEIRVIEGITVGTISLSFPALWMPWDPADVAAALVGATVVGGATAGTVKAGTQNWNTNRVIATKLEGGVTYGLVQKLA